MADFRQDPVSTASSGTSTTEAATINGVATGSSLLVFGTNDATTAPTITCSDGVAYTAIVGTDVTDTTNVQRNFAFLKDNSTSGNKTVTITWSLTVGARGIAICEVENVVTAGSLDKATAQVQQTPTTTADATTSGLTAALTRQPNIVVGLSMCNGGSGTPAAGTGFSSPNASYNIWSFGSLTTRIETKTTTSFAAVAATFTAAGNTAHTTQVVVLDDVSSVTASTTALENEKVPRRPPAPGPGGRQAEIWTAQPLASSQPLKSFLATEGMQRHDPPQIRFSYNPWTLTGIAAPAVGAWFDEGLPAIPKPFAPERPADPGLSLRPLGVSQPVLTFLQQNPAVPPPRQPPLPYQQQWTLTPTIVNLSPPLLNDEAQVIRPRRIRRWAPMGVMGRATVGTSSFSLLADSGGRFLRKQGTPWPMFTRTVWGLVGLSVANYQSLIDDTVAKGYTAIEFSAIHHDSRSTWVPTAGNGQLPFSKTLAGATWTGLLWPSATSTNQADFTTPITAYWNYVRDIVDYAATKGLACFLFAAYTGIGGDDGWMNEMIENGLTNMSTHGAYVATLLKTRSNIVWGMGGDKGTGTGSYSAPELAAEQGFVQGLLSVGGQASTMFGAEWHSPSIMADQTDHVTGTTGPTFGDTGTIQTFYEFSGAVAAEGRTAWGSSPTKPAVLQEGPFEDEGPSGTGDNSAATDPVRRYHAWALLNCIAGYNAGEAYVWRTNLTGTPPASDDYRNHLNSTTAQDDARMHTLYTSYQWWKLVPSGLSGMRTLTALVAGNQTLASACDPAGSILFVYSGPDGNGGSFSVDLGSATNVRLRWWNPTTGAFSTGGNANGTFSQSGTVTVTPAGNNGSGFNDWWLVCDV